GQSGLFHPHKSAFRYPFQGRRKRNGIIQINVKPSCCRLQVILLNEFSDLRKGKKQIFAG
ncbi:hypothetical protein, partial [Salmonella enterica]|uniref:hypothetical protein n=1 Tax=Salmonella enterica TaxID=28901 RepID=UPI001CA3DBA9